MTGAGARPPGRRRSPRGQGEQLREEILDAAVALLDESGSEAAVSVRAVGDRVGVTAPSIYRHFADKQALMDAVCARVFEGLAHRMDEAAAAVDDPFEGLFQRGIAYTTWAFEHPETYRMVMSNRSGERTDGVVEGIADACFLRFVEPVRACGEVFRGATPEQVALWLWSAAHGVVTLRLAMPSFPWPTTVEETFGQALQVAGGGAALLARGVEAESTGAFVALMDDLAARQTSAVLTTRARTSRGPVSS